MPDAPWNNGTEIVTGFTWSTYKIAADAVVLTLSHPRFGQLAYILGAVDVSRLVTQLQETLAKSVAEPPLPEQPPRAH